MTPNAADLKPQKKAAERSHAVAAQETALMPAFGSRKKAGGKKDSLKLNILHAVCRMCREVVCWLIFIGYASLGVFIPTWENDPISLEFFKWAETTN